MAIVYTKKALVERIQRHLANNFPSDDASLSTTEVLLMVDQALAFAMVGNVYAGAKVEGALVVPEAFLTTYLMTDLAKNYNTNEWYASLPQPPVSLPLGYSITNVYFTKPGQGKSQPVLPIESKRVSYREMMPMPTGARYWIVGQTIFLKSSDGNPLSGMNLYVEMMKTRTQDINENVTAPDDIIETVFMDVVKQLAQRYQMPQDIVKDQIPAGNKSS